ncbi:hypothetical protein K450DRAFT_253118 [Umbelopsis ramanniana AG]|uniref:Uncharacterized protein n=1 Tax=Umbelopsis ramanniana AG TaxID=1314678 RepID=A0AAD5HCG5_UMBRA|nr:uncharacterized protein K450DRAFT_253118 [Umbelopsis ramanniana AG]KAI8577158.1 hypothetical protein K450DRAFT_253118 [Umbelopsis ramanniana AG]
MNHDLSDQETIRHQRPIDDQATEVEVIEADLKLSESRKERLPRHEFRKAKKLESRRKHRQAVAKERERRKKQKKEQEKDNHAEYLEQKNSWLAKEALFDKIKTAKRKAHEFELQAAQNMKASIARAVSAMPVEQHAPRYQAPQKDPKPKMPKISKMPVFIASQSTSSDPQAD